MVHEIWFMNTSTRIVKYGSQVVKLSPDFITYVNLKDFLGYVNHFTNDDNNNRFE